MTRITRRRGNRSDASEAPAKIWASSQPSRARRAVPATTATRPTTAAHAMRRRTPRVSLHSRGSRYIGPHYIAAARRASCPARARDRPADLQCGSMTSVSAARPTLPTSVVGSHGLPGWLWLAREAMETNRLGRTDVRELMEDATQVALLDQERAGVDVVSTGEMMRVRFIVGFYDRLSGLRRLEAPRKLGQPLWDTNTPFEAVEKIAAPHGLGIVEEFKLARALTTKQLKATVPGPCTLLVPLKLAGGYKDKETLLADLVGIVNAECRALVEAGADFIQIDEPHSGMYAGSAPRFDQG